MSEPESDTPLSPAHMIERADALCAEGEYHAGLFMAAAALGAAQSLEGEPELLARAYRVLASAHLCVGQLARAGNEAEHAIALWRELGGHRAELGQALYTRALVHLDSGEPALALAGLDEALALFDDDADLVDRNMVRLTLGEVAVATGDLDKARPLYHAVLADVAEPEPESDEHAAALNALLGKAFLGLGSCEARARNKDAAKDYLARSIEFFEQAYGHGHPEMHDALEQVAALYRVLGDDDAAAAVDEELRVAAGMLAELRAALRERS